MSMLEYVKEGERKAFHLKNRGSIEFNSDGKLSQDIVDAYWKYGFYVFEGAIGADELNDLQTDLERLLEHAPKTKGADVDDRGRRAFGLEFAKPTYRFSVPLSDPVGGTSANDGRHQVKMLEPVPPKGSPDYVISGIGGPLQVMDACLRLYGHPQLLAVTESIQGPDFTPFIESMIVKPARLGRSVAWHQDGTTHWGSPDWDQGTHGFNFMAQFYGSTAANGVWVIPGSHKRGKLDIRKIVKANEESELLPDAIPMVCEPGDVVIANRQILHASFPNTSPDKRVTFNFGFHRRASVLGTKKMIGEDEVVYDEERIHERSRVVGLAIDARRQRFPDETGYVYQPLIGEEEENLWSQVTRETVLRNYTEYDLGI